MPNFARRLKREAKWQLIARSLGALVVGFLCWSGLLILLDLYDAFSPIQETEISSWMVGALICSSLFFLGLLLYTWIKRPNSKELARTVESANPELGDLLNTAIEIEGRSEEPKFMERRVLAQLDKRALSLDWGKGLRPTQRYWNFLLFGFGFFINYLFWVKNPFFVFEETKNFFLVFLLLIILLSLILSLIFTIILKLGKNIPIFFLIPFMFTITEYIISIIFYGFPWFTFSLVISSNEYLLFSLKSFGTLISSYLIIQIFCLPFIIIAKVKLKKEIGYISFFIVLPIIFLMPVFLFATEETDERKVSDLSINELKEIVRLIVEESIEQCTVTGTMEGRAKVNLKVEGEVVAKMTCDFEKE